MWKAPAPLLLALLIACAPPGAVTPAPAPATSYPSDLLWTRTAAEHHALFIQTYRAAREMLAAQSRDRPSGTWAVIVDADETLLDNSDYQVRLHLTGASFDNDTWNVWVRERAATALPGAVDYVDAVRALGGRVVVVTNRDEEVCDPTRDNLRAVGLVVDLVLCRSSGSDKQARFDSVRNGVGTMPPMEVLQWVGDNIQDFPSMTQAARDGGSAPFGMFGERYFILPNPMYGSFERNAPR
jgi:5'-nucleotidase (lipoprotein e(P4) family)